MNNSSSRLYGPIQTELKLFVRCMEETQLIDFCTCRTAMKSLPIKKNLIYVALLVSLRKRGKSVNNIPYMNRELLRGGKL